MSQETNGILSMLDQHEAHVEEHRRLRGWYTCPGCGSGTIPVAHAERGIYPIIEGKYYHKRCARMNWIAWYRGGHFNYLPRGRRNDYHKRRTDEVYR